MQSKPLEIHPNTVISSAYASPKWLIYLGFRIKMKYKRNFEAAQSAVSAS
jgi:hypothetical protein